MAVLSLLADSAVADVSDPSFAVTSLPLLADAGAAVERGPFVGAPATHTADIRVEIVNLDATYSHIDWVTGSSKRSLLRPLAEPGSHSITIQNDSPEAASIDVNTALRYWYKGRPAVVGICEPQESTLIALKKDLKTTWSGRLVEAFVLGAMEVYPAISVGRKPIQENRNLDYTEPVYDDSPWPLANVIGSVETARFLYWYLSPFIQLFNDTPDDIARSFPDPFAALISAPGSTLLRGRPLPLDSGGDHYVRQSVTIANDGSYDGYLLGDDSVELAIDGVPIASAGTGFMANSTFAVDLTAGTHVFAMHINNRTDAQIAWTENPGGEFNPGFGAWSLFRSGFTGVEGFVAHSDGTAKILPYAPRVPGMTYGRAIRLLVEEAEDRGCVAPALGFTDSADSDGVPWQYGVVSTRVMNDVYSTLKELSVANIDFSFRSGGFVLDAWNFGGKGSVSAVPFTEKVGANPATMTSLTKKGGGPVTNALLERTAYGWDEVDRASSIATYGRQEAGYSLGAANSQVDATTVADGRLDIVSVPRYQYEAIHDTTDDDHWAFNGFDLGDHVPFTPPGGSTTLERVVSIQIAEGDDTGRAIETVSLRDVVYYASPIEHFVGLLGQWAKKMIPGTGRGSWPETQPVTPPATASRLVKWQPVSTSGWFELTGPPSPFDSSSPPAAVLVDGDTSCLVGAGSGSDDVWVYDFAADTYTPTDPAPSTGHRGGPLVGTKSYLLGNTAAWWESGSWTSGADHGLEPAAPDGGIAAVGGVIYAMFTFGPHFMSYDIGTNTWTELAYPTMSTDVNVDNALVDAGGGFVYLFTESATSYYNIGTDQWDDGGAPVLTPRTTALKGSAVGVIDGFVYLAGGYDALNDASDALDIYDIDSDTWTAGPAMPTGDLASIAGIAPGVVHDGSLYVFGYNGSPGFELWARKYVP